MAAAQGLSSVEDQLQQLGSARALVLTDPVYWPQVLHGILPIVSGPVVELRRWGADFLAETFSTPVVEAGEKLNLAVACLDTMVRLMDEREAGILKSVVQCSASVYPLIFRYICNNREDAATWKKMDVLKSKILSLWDTGPVGVRLCCIKFVQRVILVQSRGVTDPRLADRSEISLSMVPTNHPILSLPALDAEAQGLLDRLLGVLHEDPRQENTTTTATNSGESSRITGILIISSDATLIVATLNNLAQLVKTRNPIAAKIVGAVLSFNPLAIVSRSNTIQNRLMMQCMEKTVRVLLLNIVRANPQGPFTGKVSQHLTRLSRMKADLLEELSRKRAAPTSDNDAVKRLKTDQQQQHAVVTPTPTPPPVLLQQQIISGPMSYAQLYSLSTDVAMTSFDGQQLPLELILEIINRSMYNVQQHNLDAAISAVRNRYDTHLSAPPPIPSEALAQSSSQPLNYAPPPATTDEPHAGPFTDAIENRIGKQEKEEDKVESNDEDEEESELQLGKFCLPPPPTLSREDLRESSFDAVNRIFSVIDQFDKTSLVSRKSKLGVMRLAASNWDREGWTTLITRLATRGMGGIQGEDNKPDEGSSKLQKPSALSNFIRDKLYLCIIEDFRGRMDIAISWLNEEWYNDKVMTKAQPNRQPQYKIWMMKVMDGIFPFLEGKDRMFMRLLSEIPEITVELLQKVKMLCLDPDRAVLGIQMLHFLAMLRPPVRNMCMDVLEDLWLNHTELRGQTHKLILKWRPEVLAPKPTAPPDENAGTPETQIAVDIPGGSVNGNSAATATATASSLDNTNNTTMAA
ncbi:unnamed protein product [Tuber melanosporum]|uniref:(Perigord truffle) hypothetical protein n=1 Tax=Tuber melanosporum (strain Mel28) TaxID=656061 RepID=D5G5W3_TUBMM|nr:uncharacterized protein GSTUM_00001600001 [Tuber melanosporum]CAZ79906.1 unnamed protein product [Tuber melanosporum]